jgi:hypothetical protein
MSLVLNGGVGGSGTTQCAYVDQRIISTIPCTIAAWFRTGSVVNSAGQLAGWVKSDAAVGTSRMTGGGNRSSGPQLVRNITCRLASALTGNVGTMNTLLVNVTSIISGTTTQVGVEDATMFSAGEFVKLDGTFSGLTGISSGRDWRINSISGSTLTLALSTTGTWDEGLAATVKWSAWQPDEWNLAVFSFTAISNQRLQSMGGFVGNTALSIYDLKTGTAGQYPADVLGSLDRIVIGGLYQSSTLDFPWRGEIAHVAVWNNVVPTSEQAAELLTKAPHLVGWGSPLTYWPLLADETDSIGSNHLTLVGSPDITSDGPSIQLTSGGGGGSGYLPTIMRAQPINLFGF